jgi:uncharacterized membrane protein
MNLLAGSLMSTEFADCIAGAVYSGLQEYRA